MAKHSGKSGDQVRDPESSLTRALSISSLRSKSKAALQRFQNTTKSVSQASLTTNSSPHTLDPLQAIPATTTQRETISFFRPKEIAELPPQVTFESHIKRQGVQSARSFHVQPSYPSRRLN